MKQQTQDRMVTFRVNEAVIAAASAKAEREGRSLSAVIREGLAKAVRQ